MNNQQAKDLIDRYTRDQASPQEREQLESWYLSESKAQEPPAGYVNFEKIKRRTWVQLSGKSKINMKLLTLAAAIIACTVLFYLFFSTNQWLDGGSQLKAEQVLPGKDLAVLQLSDGRNITLTDHAPAQFVKDAGVKVSTNKKGVITYALGAASAGKPEVRKITTPRGGQFRVYLPDGSLVFLNSASALTYSIGKATPERIVELSGEAYFEVAPNKKQPFQVLTGGQKVTVLGTHFNIEAYPDERTVKTALYEGSVAIDREGKHQLIVPGEEAITSSIASEQIKVIKTGRTTGPDWTQGKIYFKNENLEEILRRAARWYDIEVEIKGDVSAQIFTGGISRQSNLSALLTVLEKSDVKFTLVKEGSRVKLIVEP